MQVPYALYNSQFFLPFCILSFFLLLKYQNFYFLVQFIFFFSCLLFLVYLRNKSLVQGHEDLLLFFPNSFIVSSPIFNSVIHLWVYFYMVRCRSQHPFFRMWLFSYSNIICWKHSPLPLLKSVDLKCACLLHISNSVSSF